MYTTNLTIALTLFTITRYVTSALSTQNIVLLYSRFILNSSLARQNYGDFFPNMPLLLSMFISNCVLSLMYFC